MAVLIGTSGLSYDHWVGILTQIGKEPGPARRLRPALPHCRGEQHFYRWPKDEVFSTWRERSPEGFIFSAKASRGLTQFRKLNDPDPWLERMEAGLSQLREKGGVLLYQLPPHFPINLDRLDRFLSVAPRQGGRRRVPPPNLGC